MLLYVGMFPNKVDLGMPIFLILCSDDNDSRQVGTAALYISIKAVFRNMDTILPNAIVIDKDKT
jgi:hypothetical protein